MTSRRSSLAAVVAAVVATVAAGLDPTAVSLASSPARQARDGAAPRVVGTSQIAGVLLESGADVPIRRALVTATGEALGGQSRTSITDDDGRFVLAALPAGRVTLEAKKAAYLPASYGARRPGRPGTAIQLPAGQRIDVTLRMTRGAVVTGVIRDEQGTPLPGVHVVATTADAPPATPFSNEGWFSTDDRGAYRIFGLAPGEYVVIAVLKRDRAANTTQRREADVDAVFAGLRQRSARGLPGPPRSGGIAPVGGAPLALPPGEPIGYPITFFPGTPAYAQAARLRLAAGEERTGVDFALRPVRLTSISGTVVVGDASSLGTPQLSITFDGPRVTELMGVRPNLSKRPEGDGQFQFTQVPPGRYTIMARARPGQMPVSAGRGGIGGGIPLARASGDDQGMQFAAVDLEIAEQDVGGVTLVLRPGTTVAGRIAFDTASTAAPTDLTGVLIALVAEGSTSYSVSGSTIIGNAFRVIPPFRPAADGTFRIAGVPPGEYRMRLTLPGPLQRSWTPRSALFGGRDLLDAPLIVTGDPIDGVVLTLTDRRTALSGSLTSAEGLAAPDYFVVLFPADRSLWTRDSRRIRSARPATDGQFSMDDLVAGDYLLAALVDLDASDLADPGFLEQIASGAIRVTLREGAAVRQDIRIAR